MGYVKIMRYSAIILAVLGIITACAMVADYYYRPPLPLSDPRSDSIGNVPGSLYYFIPAVLVYAFLTWLYMKNVYRFRWYVRIGVALVAWGGVAGALALAIHRGGVEALFVWYTILVAVFCALAAMILPFLKPSS